MLPKISLNVHVSGQGSGLLHVLTHELRTCAGGVGTLQIRNVAALCEVQAKS